MSCAIEVVGSDGTFSPRDTINGVVSVRLPTETHINNISCSITGKEKSAWSITENIYNQRTKNFCTGIVYYTGENTLLSDSVILTSDADVDAGVHEYPFTYMLPRNIPNSYKSNYGSIEYKIHVVVHTKTGYEYEAEKLISVKAPINFNDIRSELQLEPVAYQNEEVMWHCCYAGDPITMDLVLEREAFVVTEPICFKLDVNNKSGENIEDINVTLTLFSAVQCKKHKSEFDYICVARLIQANMPKYKTNLTPGSGRKQSIRQRMKKIRDYKRTRPLLCDENVTPRPINVATEEKTFQVLVVVLHHHTRM
ncbi:arrestin domain-containing protein 1-like isoform X3 [Diorhabda carinulata]|uniref:arrestin domain-containing protein 1-like isoform X3 n=1 Tax=Diorhabda carinulata TaxID=1163345 RepID=UPI0025A04DF6|nr:arrestin domain-containing protein 1-like isoform X3 [Diorhabda carinulata]